MPSHVVRFKHDSTVAGSQVLTTAFGSTKVHVHDLNAYLPAPLQAARRFSGIINGLFIQLNSAGSPTTVTVRVCSDATGNVSLVPDTVATLVAGITDATTKSAAFAIDLPLFQTAVGGNFYVFAKVDDGTGNPTLARTILTWQE
jgi:hypothetical protein